MTPLAAEKHGQLSVGAGADLPVLGWVSGTQTPAAEALGRLRETLYVVRTEHGIGYVRGKSGSHLNSSPVNGSLPVVAVLAGAGPEHLGDPSFRADYGLRYAYYSGAMANGIGSTRLVRAMGEAGMLGFFGSAGLSVDRVRAAIDELESFGGAFPYGFNFIHSPNESALEAALAELYIERGIRLVEASAFLRLTLPLVRYRLHGIHEDGEGGVVTPNRVIAKVSRIEIAEKFFSPAPEKMVQKLVASGDLTLEQGELAKRVPVAQDLTAEADSGGHTDNRPAIALLPTMLAFRDRMQREYRYEAPLRVGLAGGISTPASAAAAFAMGAAYIVTGSINQSCVEAGTSDAVRQMLAESQQADVIMAPAADMFEMGVKVQVLKRGTMFAMRGAKLYELYRGYNDVDSLPAAEREKLEKTVFRASLDDVWRETEVFFRERDPKEIERANKDPRHKMALIFRSYLGQSSNWANAGDSSRKVDYQVWCGPAMGAFNEWVSGSFLESWERREAPVVALNILYGAAVCLRCAALRAQGISVPEDAVDVRPRTVAEIEARI